MSDMITMTRSEQQRSMVLTKLFVGELASTDAAELLAASTHTIRRLRRRLERTAQPGWRTALAAELRRGA